MPLQIFIRLIANAFALFVADKILDAFTIHGGIPAFLIFGGVVGVLNLLVKPILKFIAFPLVFFSAGFFLIIINAAILYLAKYLLDVMDFTGISVQVDNLLTYVLAAVIFGVANWFISWLIKD